MVPALGSRPQSVRLIGLRTEQLESAEGAALQLSLDGREDSRQEITQHLCNRPL